MSRRCVFLDRDGVINVKAAPGDYIKSWNEFQFLPGIADWIRLFNALDLVVIVVTNQRGVARKLIETTELEKIHAQMVDGLSRAGARIDDILCCPHEENTCHCRKPKPGLIVEAQKRWDIDLSQSLMIGDSNSDRELAATCGMSFVQVLGGRIITVAPLAPIAERLP